jgi:hypothetical protein
MDKLLRLALVALSLATAFGNLEARPSSTPPRQAAAPPARTVKGQVLTSAAAPALALEFGKEFKYVGSQDFILYNVARAEQHFFVDADKEGRIRRLYWVQFEGYLPDNTHAYDYKANKVVNLGGLDFIADAAARNMKINLAPPDSDGARARAFLEGKGYRLASDDLLWQRLVHMVDEARRNELMIIYMEDLSATGLKASDLWRGGRAESQWDEVAKQLLDRAVKSIKVRR